MLAEAYPLQPWPLPLGQGPDGNVPVFSNHDFVVERLCSMVAFLVGVGGGRGEGGVMLPRRAYAFF